MYLLSAIMRQKHPCILYILSWTLAKSCIYIWNTCLDVNQANTNQWNTIVYILIFHQTYYKLLFYFISAIYPPRIFRIAIYTGQVVQDKSHSLEASNIPDIKLAFYKEMYYVICSLICSERIQLSIKEIKTQQMVKYSA